MMLLREVQGEGRGGLPGQVRVAVFDLSLVLILTRYLEVNKITRILFNMRVKCFG